MRRLCLSLLSVLAACSGDEPTVEGRSLSRWQTSLKSTLVQERMKAAEVMGQFGEPALEAQGDLVAMLSDSAEPVRMAAAYALAKLGRAVVPALEQKLADSDLVTRMYAAVALVRLDAAHAAGQKVLLNALTGVGNSKMSERARLEVVKIGEPLVPALALLLDDPYAPVRVVVLDTLAELKEKARPVGGKVTEQLAHTDAGVRRAGLRALAAIGPNEVVAPAIEKLAGDADSEVARTAKEMLLYVTPQPAEPYGAEK